jgi:hypothetical protein
MSRNVCFWHKADLRRVELLKELTQLMDEPDSKGGKSKSSRAGLSGPGRYWPVSGPSGRFCKTQWPVLSAANRRLHCNHNPT